ncbi:hypothetical protein JOC75_003617 [Metabacillus crassostreae]|uniref:hypothetical protein n=1 Tax=Metabacillus crassostreae TaxID=929098 RepID=UPI00195B6CF9|nr:hypothetical protein [Metabacillus crassostreae]MBM7605594.1 hypothetical protein [Metabacillus crassostreae]
MYYKPPSFKDKSSSSLEQQPEQEHQEIVEEEQTEFQLSDEASPYLQFYGRTNTEEMF